MLIIRERLLLGQFSESIKESKNRHSRTLVSKEFSLNMRKAEWTCNHQSIIVFDIFAF